MRPAPFDNLDNYKSVITRNLTETHACPPQVCEAIMSDYADEIAAMFEHGVAAVSPAKLLYAEWKVFRSA